MNVQENYTVRQNFTLKAGQITVTPASISKTVPWQGTATANITVKNTGTAPATVNVGEQPGGSTPLLTGGAPLHQVSGKFSSHSLKSQGKATGTAPVNAEPADAPWTAIANYPTAIQDNVAGVYNGKLYSAFGYTGSDDVSSLYVYDPDSGAWSPLASAADTREKPAAAFINGKFYVVGGWAASGSPDAKMEIYDPASNSWSTGVALAEAVRGFGHGGAQRQAVRHRRLHRGRLRRGRRRGLRPGVEHLVGGGLVPRGDRLAVLRDDRHQALLRRWNHRRR